MNKEKFQVRLGTDWIFKTYNNEKYYADCFLEYTSTSYNMKPRFINSYIMEYEIFDEETYKEARIKYPILPVYEKNNTDIFVPIKKLYTIKLKKITDNPDNNNSKYYAVKREHFVNKNMKLDFGITFDILTFSRDGSNPYPYNKNIDITKTNSIGDFLFDIDEYNQLISSGKLFLNTKKFEKNNGLTEEQFVNESTLLDEFEVETFHERKLKLNKS